MKESPNWWEIENTSKEHFDYDSFMARIRETARKAYDEKSILSHALLVYDLRHAHLVDVLRQAHYYEALNKLAGKWLNIYHAASRRTRRPKPRPNRHGEPEFQFLVREAEDIYQDSYTDTIEKLSREYDLPNLDRDPLIFVLLRRGRRNQRNLCVFDRGEILRRNLRVMASVIKEVKAAVDGIDMENIGNRETIFQIQTDNLRFLRMVHTVRRIPILKIVSLLKGHISRKKTANI